MTNMNKVVDLATDAGFETLVTLIKEGSLNKLPRNLDLEALLEKQAFQDECLFADSKNKRFSIATPVETYISARYAEKCASEVPPSVLDALNEACDVFGIDRCAPLEQNASVADLSEVFSSGNSDPKVSDEKVASANDEKDESYGTEFDMCLAARAALFPDEMENLDKIASLKETLPPKKMASLLAEYDQAIGADVPWVQNRVGSPEYAVYKKASSNVDIELGGKMYPIEELAEKVAAFESMGIDIDFDEDPYTVKLAVERLPQKVKVALSKIL